jgi:hypothetical protein
MSALTAGCNLALSSALVQGRAENREASLTIILTKIA